MLWVIQLTITAWKYRFLKTKNCRHSQGCHWCSLQKHPFLLPLRRWGPEATKSEEKRMFSQAIIDDNNIKVPWGKDNNNDRHNETFFHHLVSFCYRLNWNQLFIVDWPLGSMKIDHHAEREPGNEVAIIHWGGASNLESSILIGICMMIFIPKPWGYYSERHLLRPLWQWVGLTLRRQWVMV